MTNYTVSQKNVRYVIDFNSKKDYPILIIFGMNVLDATGY